MNYVDKCTYFEYNVLVYQVHLIHIGVINLDIIISSSSGKPIYEQITTQMKAMIMNGTLQPGDSIPSMRQLAKALHVSVITVQKAYEDLNRDGFIETTVGKGSFVSQLNKDFVLEEKQRQTESYLIKACDIARENGISKEKLIQLVNLFYDLEE